MVLIKKRPLMENDTINEHKYLSNHYGIKLYSKMERLHYWIIPKLHTNPVGPWL